MAVAPYNLLQTKIFSILNGDGPLNDLIDKVHDNAPDNSDYPYVVVGDDDLSDFSSHTNDGFEGDVTVDTWTQSEGRKQCKAIQERIYTLLHNIDLGIVGFKTISFRCTLTNILKDPDGRTHHGVQVFSILLGGN